MGHGLLPVQPLRRQSEILPHFKPDSCRVGAAAWKVIFLGARLITSMEKVGALIFTCLPCAEQKKELLVYSRNYLKPPVVLWAPGTIMIIKF